jgi:formate/nitrite transporter FocA (FNT family)
MSTNKKEVLLPNGEKVPAEGTGTHSERTIQRLEEEHEYASVIIKRNDAAFKHPDDVLQNAIEGGREQVNRSALSLFLSAISAGLILGFSAMAVSFLVSILPMETAEGIKRLAMAVVYPLGFIICIMSRTELFTEHTALAVYPYLEKMCSLKKLLRLWIIVLIGNLVGTAASAILLNLAEPIIQAENGYAYVAEHLVGFSGFETFISAMLAGWLMALGSWLILSMATSSAQILGIYIVTFLIGIGGLHHSIAGSAELFTALLMTDSISLAATGHTLFYAIIGNLVGGSFFVAILNYAHIRKTQSIKVDEKI